MTTITTPSTGATDHWLRGYYLTRALVSAVWVGLAFTIGKTSPPAAIALLLLYPAWDCVANIYDARRNGGFGANSTQAFNAVVSAIVTIAIAVTVRSAPDFHAAIGVIGVWAALAGLLQLATGVRRWRSTGAQWPMILSGGQSALAGAHFLIQAIDPAAPVGVATVAPYAGFGAFYFAISTIILTVKVNRAPRASRMA
ncbi:DUF308 domain-containing protein [Sphingomonas sp. AP4-R1]|uniref:DUF308 domain-containing protein n=1 Tax=Sphingomonas sp. AP4-R1 TaxID=2735134 RepID=UPI001493C811|nr:DUF308 domain-containing protein [Sphingomonas sp. AP4-R1]QJU59419.1 DUF308 domain-containing protein [Sphingomonas sp. AP4-R1]